MPGEAKKLSERAKEHPIMVTLTTVALIGGALTAMANITGFWDKTHTSEFELNQALIAHARSPHEAAAGMIEENRRQQRCSTIDIKISIIEQQIWQMEQAQDNSPRLVEKRRELKKLEDRRHTLKCAELD